MEPATCNLRTLVPPGTQYRATLSNPEQRKPLRYAQIASPCIPLQRLMDHSYLEQVSGSSPLVGSLSQSATPIARWCHFPRRLTPTKRSATTPFLKGGGNSWADRNRTSRAIPFRHKVLRKEYGWGNHAPKCGVVPTPSPHNIHPAKSAGSKGVASGPDTRITGR